MKQQKETDVLEIKIDSINDLYSNFSINNNKILNPEIQQYISSNVEGFSKRNSLKIKFSSSKKPTIKEKDEAKTVLKNTYKKVVDDCNKTINLYYILSLIFLLIGTVSIVVLHVISSYAPYVIKTILEIISWVFVWEFVDVLCFRAIFRIIKNNQNKKIYKSEIEF